jgi:hypothetical protein
LFPDWFDLCFGELLLRLPALPEAPEAPAAELAPVVPVVPVVADAPWSFFDESSPPPHATSATLLRSAHATSTMTLSFAACMSPA